LLQVVTRKASSYRSGIRLCSSPGHTCSFTSWRQPCYYWHCLVHPIDTQWRFGDGGTWPGHCCCCWAVLAEHNQVRYMYVG